MKSNVTQRRRVTDSKPQNLLSQVVDVYGTFCAEPSYTALRRIYLRKKDACVAMQLCSFMGKRYWYAKTS